MGSTWDSKGAVEAHGDKALAGGEAEGSLNTNDTD